ncbi:aspartic peptidase domain-containing protein [Mycena albidolilacea]|uniref:Aspartic peptidase domain-containing protein n=1 Tax=Mycena albidolilacea TaxID=1033008 RepID=A0AAD6Z3R7_9AGAR|nr:aspartic peptidase domain-containing protein [Mycena albidolilacea]
MLSLPLAVAAFLLVPVFSAADPVHVQIQRGPNTLETHLDYLAAADLSRARYGYSSTAFSTTKPLRRRGIAQSSDFGNLVQRRYDLLWDGQYRDGVIVLQFLFSKPPMFMAAVVTSRPQSLNVVLDTGSSDLPYASGKVSGVNSTEDDMSVTSLSGQLLGGSVSGIMGLAFDAIAATRTTPFWQGLLSSNQLAAPEMAFWLTRFLGTKFTEEESGGEFTLGGRNTSLFQGDIEFLNLSMAADPTYWLLRVSGKSANVATGNTALAAINTGTTLLGGPTADVHNIWAQVPGSSSISRVPGFFHVLDEREHQHLIRGKTWPIAPADMNLGTVNKLLGQGDTGSLALMAVQMHF